MRICPRCKEWRTKAQLRDIETICKRCVREVDGSGKKGNFDQPKMSPGSFRIPGKYGI